MTKRTEQILSFLLIIASIAFANYYYKWVDFGNFGKTEEQKDIIEEKNELKEVEVFVVGQDRVSLTLEKTGTSESQAITQITSQLAGQIQEIKVSLGDKVEKNTELIKLGGSLSSDISALQEKTAAENKYLSEINRNLTTMSGFNNRDSALLAAQSAYNNYQTALETKQNTLALFDQQYENTQIEIDNAKLGYDNSLNTIDSLKDQLNDLDDDYDDIKDDIYKAQKNNLPEESIEQLYAAKDKIKDAINNLENQIDSAKIAEDISNNRIKQAKLGAEQLISNYNSNFTQLDLNIANSKNQYLAALSQIESVNIGTQMQQLGAESQILQSELNLKSTQINRSYETIKSTINGTVTQINAKEGNLINPGQVLITIENNDQIIIKTNLSPKEAEFIKIGDLVEINYNKAKTQGTITNISPTLNPQTRKVEVEIAVEENSKIDINAIVKVKFIAKKENTFFIPLNSIVLINGEKNIRYLDNKNQVKYKKVEIGELFNEEIEIISGIKKGDKIITTTEIFLQEKETVKIKQ